MKRRAEHFIEQWYRKQRRKPLVIRGARQVGKSTLVRRVAKTLDVHCGKSISSVMRR